LRRASWNQRPPAGQALGFFRAGALAVIASLAASEAIVVTDDGGCSRTPQLKVATLGGKEPSARAKPAVGGREGFFGLLGTGIDLEILDGCAQRIVEETGISRVLVFSGNEASERRRRLGAAMAPAKCWR